MCRRSGATYKICGVETSLSIVLPGTHCMAHPFESHRSATQLPYGHEYCKACVEELRHKGVDKSCPYAASPLLPGPEKLFDLSYGMYMTIKGAIDRSLPSVDERTTWPPSRLLRYSRQKNDTKKTRRNTHTATRRPCVCAGGMGEGLPQIVLQGLPRTEEDEEEA